MLRTPLIYLIYASALSIVLTSVVMSTQVGDWLARITLIFLPDCQRLLHKGIYNFHTVPPALSVHFLWGAGGGLPLPQTNQTRQKAV